MSHAGFLRQHWSGEDEGWTAYVRGFWDAGQDVADMPLAEAVDHVYRCIDALAPGAGLDEQDVAQLRYVARVALAPRTCRARHLDELRAAGFDDRAILDLVNIVALFAYMNRLVDGLGVHLQPHSEAMACELFGEEALRRHLEWAKGD